VFMSLRLRGGGGDLVERRGQPREECRTAEERQDEDANDRGAFLRI